MITKLLHVLGEQMERDLDCALALDACDFAAFTFGHELGIDEFGLFSTCDGEGRVESGGGERNVHWYVERVSGCLCVNVAEREIVNDVRITRCCSLNADPTFPVSLANAPIHNRAQHRGQTSPDRTRPTSTWASQKRWSSGRQCPGGSSMRLPERLIDVG